MSDDQHDSELAKDSAVTTKDDASIGFRNVRLARGRSSAVEPSDSDDADVKVLAAPPSSEVDPPAGGNGDGDGAGEFGAIDLTDPGRDVAVTALVVDPADDDDVIDATNAATLEPRVRREIVAAIASDPVLGVLHAHSAAGNDTTVAPSAVGSPFVATARLVRRAVVDGEVPDTSSVALGAARVLRRLLRRHVLSPVAARVVDDRLAQLEKRGADPALRSAEDRRARTATREAEERATTGIYVYTFPHYARAPYDDPSGRTLLRVMRADRSVIRRVHEQLHVAALPEDPVLVRVYATKDEDATAKERMFHRLLDAAAHERSPGRDNASDWFLTSVRFLDEIASTFGLDVEHVNGLADCN